MKRKECVKVVVRARPLSKKEVQLNLILNRLRMVEKE